MRIFWQTNRNYCNYSLKCIYFSVLQKDIGLLKQMAIWVVI